MEPFEKDPDAILLMRVLPVTSTSLTAVQKTIFPTFASIFSEYKNVCQRPDANTGAKTSPIGVMKLPINKLFIVKPTTSIAV